MQTPKKLLLELAQIHDLRASIFGLGLEHSIGVKYLPLATDPGSHYWDLAAAGASRNEMIDRLLQSHKEFLLPTFRTDPGVMSLYRPRRMSAAFALVFSSVVRFIDLLGRLQFGYYFHATRLVGFDAMWQILRALAERGIAGDPAISGLLTGMRTLLSAQRDATLLLALVQHELMRVHGKKLARYRHYLAGLLSVETAGVKASGGFRVHPTAAVLEAEAIDGHRLPLAQAPILDRGRLVLTHYRYGTRDAYHALTPLGPSPRREKMLYLFLPEAVLELSADVYPILQLFDGRHAVADVVKRAQEAAQLTPATRQQLALEVIPRYFYFTR